MVISVVLLPAPDDSNQLVAFSEQLNATTTSLIQLGENFLPHITLAQFKAPAEETKNLWQGVEHLKNKVTKIQAAGLGYVPMRDKSAIWVELQFLKSAALSELRREVLATAFAKSSEVTVYSSRNEDDYRPQATVGLLEGTSTPELNLEPAGIFGREFNNVRLAVGVNGEHFTFAKADFS